MRSRAQPAVSTGLERSWRPWRQADAEPIETGEGRRRALHLLAPTVPACGLALLPKCPICFAACASFLGLTSVGPGSVRAVLLVVLALALVISGYGVLRRRRAASPSQQRVGQSTVEDEGEGIRRSACAVGVNDH